MYDFEDLLGGVAFVGLIALIIWMGWYSTELVKNCEDIGGSYATRSQLCVVDGKVYTNRQVIQMLGK